MGKDTNIFLSKDNNHIYFHLCEQKVVSLPQILVFFWKLKGNWV
jgi:hypothetical protein